MTAPRCNCASVLTRPPSAVSAAPRTLEDATDAHLFPAQLSAGRIPEELYVARRRSPMVLGLGDRSTYVASEALAFSARSDPPAGPGWGHSAVPISTGMALRTREQCKDIAHKIVNRHHAFVPGKGWLRCCCGCCWCRGCYG